MARIIYVTGGARSGKSTFAEKQAAKYKQVQYIATAACTDDEMRQRIIRHQNQRPSFWHTVEEQYKPYLYINNKIEADAILLDCLSVWVSNLLLQYWHDDKGFICAKNDLITSILSEVDKLILAAAKYKKTLIIVSNEVGSGIVPMSALARYYRDCLGLSNQKIAGVADQVYWCISGIPMLIKGENNEE